MPISNTPTFDLELNQAHPEFVINPEMTFSGNDTYFLEKNANNRCGSLVLELHKEQHNGKPFTGAEYRSVAHYGYGRYEFRMKAPYAPGVVASAFLFQEIKADGTTWLDLSAEWAEIDIEFRYGPADGKPYLQFNHIDAPGSYHEQSFDETATPYRDKIRDYAIEVTPTNITWYVGTDVVATANSELPYNHGARFKIMMNLWCPSTTWAGHRELDLEHELAIYKRVAFYPWY